MFKGTHCCIVVLYRLCIEAGGHKHEMGILSIMVDVCSIRVAGIPHMNVAKFPIPFFNAICRYTPHIQYVN